jgi:hypothetical protein
MGSWFDEAKAIVDSAAITAGRDPASLGMEGRVSWSDGGVDHILDQAQSWRDARATHFSINTMGAGFGSVEDHLGALEGAAQALGLSRA